MDTMDDIGNTIKTEIDFEYSEFPEKVIVKEEQELQIPEEMPSSDYSRIQFTVKEEVNNMFGKCTNDKTEYQCENTEETVKNEEDKIELSETNLELNDYNNIICKEEAMKNEEQFGMYENVKTEIRHEALYGDNVNIGHRDFIENYTIDEQLNTSELTSPVYDVEKMELENEGSKNQRKNNSRPNLHHSDSIHNAHKPKINCQFCDELFTSERSLKNQLLKQHKYKDNLKNEKYRCDSCSHGILQKCDLISHNSSLNNKEKTKKNCQFCKKIFMSKQSLFDHLLKKHKEEINNIKGYITNKIYSCIICSYQTVFKVHFNKHVNANHNKHRTKISCEFCAKLFVSKTSFDDHLLKQHKQEIKDDLKSFITSKVYKCDNCSYETILKYCLIRHTNTRHNEQKSQIKCQFCDKIFMSKQTLNDHLLKQHQQKIKNNVEDFITTKIYSCSICSYQTGFRHSFDRHFNSNHNQHRTKVKCQFCIKTFLSKMTLDDHLLKQHKKKITNDFDSYITSYVFKCNICCYQTAIKNHLVRHFKSKHNSQTTRKEIGHNNI